MDHWQATNELSFLKYVFLSEMFVYFFTLLRLDKVAFAADFVTHAHRLRVFCRRLCCYIADFRRTILSRLIR